MPDQDYWKRLVVPSDWRMVRQARRRGPKALDRVITTAEPMVSDGPWPFRLAHALSLPHLQPAAGRRASPWGKPEIF